MARQTISNNTFARAAFDTLVRRICCTWAKRNTTP